MFYLYIIEDNEFHLLYLQENIQMALEKVQLPYTINVVKDIMQFYEKLKKNALRISDNAIFIIDVHLNQSVNGLDIAEKIRKNNRNCFITFCTSDDSKALEAIQRHVIVSNYIVKEKNAIQTVENQLVNTFSFVKKALSSRNKNEEIKQKDEHVLKVNWGANLYTISMSEIIFIETLTSAKNKTKVVTANGDFILNQPIHELKEQIKAPYMYKELKSFIINLNWILAIRRQNKEITLKNGQILYVGTRIIDKVRREMGHYLDENPIAKREEKAKNYI